MLEAMMHPGWTVALRRLVVLLWACAGSLGVWAQGTADAVPQRIVSLLPSLTESVCALGQCQRLVGVERYSNWPTSVQQLPKVGGGLDPSIEAIVALKPDLVLMAHATRLGERLQAMGIRVLQLEPKSHAEVRQALLVIGAALNVPQAERIWREIDAGVQAAAASLSPRSKQARVYFEVNRAPYAASESSFIGETLARLGVRNIVPGHLGPFPKLNPEFVVRGDPDVIMVGDADFGGLTDRPGWRGMRAMTANRVCVFTPAQADVLVRAGPRLAEAAELMAQCLRKVLP